jgi:hypothetical protein
MNAPKPIATDTVREAMRIFCKGGKRITNTQLYAALDLQDREERAVLRTRLRDMCKRGEAVRIDHAVYEYNFKFSLRIRNTTYAAIWRFVRTQKPGWSLTYACQLTRISHTQVARYCGWLENEGYIARHGKDGVTTLYRATDKADKSPETPYPPHTDKNPFEREASAAARIATLMLCHDPYQPKVARQIADACKVLLARFASAVATQEATDEDSSLLCEGSSSETAVAIRTPHGLGNDWRDKHVIQNENGGESNDQ